MKRLEVVIVAVVSAVFASCEIGDRVYDYNAPGYVSEYYVLDDDNVSVESNLESGKLSIILKIESGSKNFVSVCEYRKHKKKSNYYDLCRKFGDLHYNQSVIESMGYLKCSQVNVLADILTDIRILGDDGKCSACLNELFSLRYYTVYPYIESGYFSDDQITEIDEPLSNIDANDLKMLMYFYNQPYALELPSDDWRYLAFLELYTDKLPDSPIQSLHITLTTDDSKTLEYSVELDLR